MTDCSKLSQLVGDGFSIDIDQDSGCWLWTRGKDKDGYASIYIKPKMRKGHRLSYETYKGEIPGGLEIDHTCRNRACINPDHLEAVTHQENMKRGAESDRTYKLKDMCKAGHKLTEGTFKEYLERGRKRRRCIICRNRYAKISKERKLKCKNM